MRRALLIAGCAMAALGSVTTARADVAVTLTPVAASVPVSTATSETITVTSTDLATVNGIWGYLPDHGRPCDHPTVYGQPAGRGTDTNWQVTTPGVRVQGRRFDIDVAGLVSPLQPLVVTLDLVTPPLAACHYFGATAIVPGEHVVGTARGGEIRVTQAAGFATSGTVEVADRHDATATLTWLVDNDTDLQVVTERLGASDGWRLISSTLGSPNRSSDGHRWTWGKPLAGDVTETVQLERPCGIGGRALRLRITRADGAVTGTGDGVAVTARDCS